MTSEVRKISLTTKDIEKLITTGIKHYSYIDDDKIIRDFDLKWSEEIKCTIINDDLWVITSVGKELICIIHNFKEKLPPDGFIEKKVMIMSEVNGEPQHIVEKFTPDEIFAMIGLMHDREYDEHSKDEIYYKIQGSMIGRTI